MQDTVLANGTRIPRGTLVAAAARGAHHDDANYEHAQEFDAFRFARMRAAAAARGTGDTGGTKFQFVTTANDFLGFGHGKGAWWAIHVPRMDYVQKVTHAYLGLSTARGDSSRLSSSRRSWHTS